MTAQITDEQIEDIAIAVFTASQSPAPIAETLGRIDGIIRAALAPQQPSEKHPLANNAEWQVSSAHRDLDRMGIPRGDSEDYYSVWGRFKLAFEQIAKLRIEIPYTGPDKPVTYTRLDAQQPSQGAEEGGWGIDVSAGREILVYGRCSVIEEEQARYVLNLIAADMARPAPEASGAMPLSEERITELHHEAHDQALTGIAPSLYLARAIEREHGIDAVNVKEST